MSNIMVFTDSQGIEFEVRHIIEKSVRSDNTYYEANDGKWYSHDELDDDRLMKDDIIITSNEGNIYTMKLNQFNFILALHNLPVYDIFLHTVEKQPLPKGL